MKTWFIIIFILATTSQGSQYADVYTYVEQSVVLVQANDSQNMPVHQGTGVFIDKAGDIITNFHIIDGSSKINVTTEDGYTYPVKNILGKNISSDLVCLSVNIPPQLVFPISINTIPPEIGDDVLVIGYPEGPSRFAQSMTKGIVSSVQTIPEYGEVIQIDAAVSPGASGSPLVNMKCEAVGITTFGYIKGQKQNFAISCVQISNLIRYITPEQGEKPISERNLTSAERVYANALAERFYANALDLIRKDWYADITIHFLERAIELNPQYTEAWVTKGNVSFTLDKYNDAIKAYDMALDINPRLAYAWEQKGWVLSKQGKYDDAINAFNKAMEINPQLGLWSLEGVILYGQGKYNDAIKAYDKAIEMNPQNAEAWYNKGLAFKLLGRTNEADAAFAKAKELGYTG